MSATILIPSSHVKYLVPGYRQRLAEIDVLIAELKAEREEIGKIIDSVNSDSLNSSYNSESTNDGYDRNASWYSKAKFILKREGKPLTTSKIVDNIMLLQPELDRVLAVRNISSILGVKAKEEKEIERFTIEGKDQKFGLK